MTALIRAELRKILSTRLWWALLLTLVGAVAFFAATFALAIGWGDAAAGPNGEPLVLAPLDLALTVYTAGVSLAYVFPVAFGAIIVTSEFRHRTIISTVLAEPRRSRIVLAKLIAAMPFAVLYGAATAVTAIAVGAPALAATGNPTMLGDPEVLRALGLTVVAMASWMLVGVGFGAAVPHQVGIVVGLLVWTQLVEPLIRLAAGFWGPAESIARFLPGAAGEAIVGTSVYSAAGLSSLLSPAGGLAVLLGYGALAAILGSRTAFRRDIS